MTTGIAVGALVRWNDGAQQTFGIVTATGRGGRQVTVRFDDGRTHAFVWPTETLSRVELMPGQAVQLQATGERGLIGSASKLEDRTIYTVSMPDGSQKTVMEDGLRIATERDPVNRLRAGELDTARLVNLRVAATRLVFAHQYDELSSLSNSRVEIKPHQVGVLHRVATTYPHRFLLADEVGLGKTIEAGLIIKELKARGFANRVLVLAPSGIVSQWQYELKTKFNQTFADYRRSSISWLESENPGENVWTLRDNVITSTTFAAWSEERRREIALAGWDLVVIDEAHHARRTWQGEHKYTETNLYKLAEMLADPDLGRAQGFLMLTATPMQLHRFELYSLIELLDPALFPTFEDFQEHAQALAGLNATVESVKRWPTLRKQERLVADEQVAQWLQQPRERVLTELETAVGIARIVDQLADKHRLSNAMIRNRKKVVGGFMPRVAALWPVELTPLEREAYDATTEYARTGYSRARAQKNNALGFLMVTFQKLNASSSFALRQSLLRRIEKLEAGLLPRSRTPSVEEEDLEERPTEEALDDWMSAGAEAEKELIRAEVAELEGLVRLLDRIPIDSKAQVLLDKLDEIAERDPNAKVIVFTQFRGTQEYLQGFIREPWTAHLFHGQLKPNEKDSAVQRFRELPGPQLLISTEAGGEGRNFQFCHMLVNYDLPWNPMKVEQRIGRIDRIGQKEAVTIFNFSTSGTVEERVVSVLAERIGVFEETIGGLDPILGNVEHDLRRIFLMAEEESARVLEGLEKQLETRVQQARQVGERLADLIMDTKSFRRDEVEQLLEHHGRSDNQDMRRFVINAFAELGAAIDEDPSVEGIYELRLSDRFFATFPQFTPEEMKSRITFEPSVALDHEEVDFLAFGHPLVDALVDRVRGSSYGGLAGVRLVLTDEQPPRSGWLFVYVLEFGGIVPLKELLPVFLDDEGEDDPEVARWLTERASVGKREDYGDASILLPPREDSFETAAGKAETLAVERLVARQLELSGANAARLADERTKIERFFDYRKNAETEKLASVERIFERLSRSDDPAVQRILPAWAKKVETARRNLATTDVERKRRLAELSQLDHVAAQHERLVACFVEIRPDPTASLPQDVPLGPGLRGQLRILACPTTPSELANRIKDLTAHVEKLEALAERSQGKFSAGDARALVQELTGAAARPDLTPENRSLLRGAVDYVLLVEDMEHDLRPGGFSDDAQVVNAVLQAIRSRAPATPAS